MMEKVIGFCKDELPIRKYLYYFSNGASIYDIKHMDGLDEGYKIKNMIVSTTRFLPPHRGRGEDGSTSNWRNEKQKCPTKG